MRQIRCDQGTNFVGAKRELDDQLLQMDHSEGEVVLKGYMSLNWNFHRGGGSNQKDPLWGEYGYFLKKKNHFNFRNNLVPHNIQST